MNFSQSDIFKIIDEAMSINDLAERESYIKNSCVGDEDLFSSVTTMIAVNEELKLNAVENSPAPVKTIKTVQEQAPLTLFDILSDIIDNDLEGEEARIKVEVLCNGDSLMIDSFYKRYQGYFDDDSEVEENILKKSYESLRNGGIDNPKELEGLIVKDYRLDEYHACGAYGFVYKGVRIDGKLKKQTVAIKVINPYVKSTLGYDLIEREADIMVTLTHKYIVTVLQLGSVEYKGMLLDCHIMEFVDGNNILEAFPFTSNNLIAKLKCMARVLDGLGLAHKKGYVHADIKPDNIKVRYPEQQGEHQKLFTSYLLNTGEVNFELARHDLDPVILDFSISPLFNDSGSLNKEDMARRVNDYSSPYSSPEFMKGKPLTPADDIYSAGVLLRALVTGISPEQDKNDTYPSDILLGERERKYQWSLKDLDAIIKMACHPIPDKRYKSMGDFKKDIYNFINIEAVQARSRSLPAKLYKKSRKHPLISTSLFMGAGAVFYSFFFNVSSMIENKQYRDDLLLSQEHASRLSTVVKPYVLIDSLDDFFFEESLKSFQTYSYGTKKKQAEYLIDIADMAKNANKHEYAVQSYETLFDDFMPELSEPEKISSTLGYAVSLDKLGKVELSQKVIAPFFNKMVKDDFSDSSIVGIFLEIFDNAIRYLDQPYSYLELLEKLEDSNLVIKTSLHASLLQYHLAKEIYYSYYGDYASTSIGLSESDYQNELVPSYMEAVEKIEVALLLLDGDRSEPYYRSKMLGVSARLAYELRDIDKAQSLSAKAVEYSQDILGNSKETRRANIIDFSINRFVDTEKALASANKVKEMDFIVKSSPNEQMQSNYYVIDTLLNMGEYQQAKLAIFSANKALPRYKLDYVGLDALRAVIVDYLFGVGFNKEDPDNKVLSVLAFDLAVRMGGRINNSELELTRLIQYYFDGTLESKHIASYIRTTKEQSNDDYSSNYVALAILSAGLGNPEMAKDLAFQYESGVVYGEFERTHSLSLMMNFIALSNIYIKANSLDLARESLRKAFVIFNSHRKALEGGYIHKELDKINQELYIT